MDTPPITSPDAWLDHLGAPALTPSGISAAAFACAMGLALLEKALGNPAYEQDQRARQEAGVVASLRRRVTLLATTDAEAWADVAEALDLPPEDEEREVAQAGARVVAYRSARRLIDLAIQGLTQLPHAMTFGSAERIADVAVGAHLIEAAFEGAVTAAEHQLATLNEAFTETERPALETQARQGREWWDRARGGLSWRGDSA